MLDKYIKASFTNFITKLIKNASYDYFNKQDRKNNINIDEIKEESICMCQTDDSTDTLFFNSFEMSSEFKLEKVFSEIKYYNAMKNLKDIQKKILYLNIIEEMTPREISNKLGLTIDNVYQIKKRAISKFLNNLKGE